MKRAFNVVFRRKRKNRSNLTATVKSEVGCGCNPGDKILQANKNYPATGKLMQVKC